MLGLERPPRWGVVALVALVVVNIALFSYLLLRPDPADPFAGASRPTGALTPTTAGSPAPEVSTAPAETTAEDGPVVLAVYGDGYSAGSTLGGQGAAGWPALVAAQIGAELRLNAAALAGYESVGAGELTFPQLAEANPVSDATITIVFGSRNDETDDPAAVGAAATAMYASIQAASPDTQLVVIGPAWSSSEVPADLETVRDAVQQAATSAGATFIDPLTDQWFSDPTGLIAADGISPLDAGHEYLAGLITPVAQSALSAA